MSQIAGKVLCDLKRSADSHWIHCTEYFRTASETLNWSAKASSLLIADLRVKGREGPHYAGLVNDWTTLGASCKEPLPRAAQSPLSPPGSAWNASSFG